MTHAIIKLIIKPEKQLKEVKGSLIVIHKTMMKSVRFSKMKMSQMMNLIKINLIRNRMMKMVMNQSSQIHMAQARTHRREVTDLN